MVASRDVSRRRWEFGGLRAGCRRKWVNSSKRCVDGSQYIVGNSQRWTFVTNKRKQYLTVSYGTTPQLPNAYFYSFDLSLLRYLPSTHHANLTFAHDVK